MHEEAGSRLGRTLFGASVVDLVTLLGCGVATVHTQNQTPRLAEEVFRNVSLLRGLPVDEFMDTMGMFSAALSLNCTDCHTARSASNWSAFAEDTPLKQTARRMIGMVNTINRTNFGGQRRVSCYTCHQGGQRPKVAPDLAVQYSTPMEDPNQMQIFTPMTTWTKRQTTIALSGVEPNVTIEAARFDRPAAAAPVVPR